LCYMSCPPHPPWIDHSNFTCRRVEVSNVSQKTNKHWFRKFSTYWF
jgi:hypothetical protein